MRRKTKKYRTELSITPTECGYGLLLLLLAAYVQGTIDFDKRTSLISYRAHDSVIKILLISTHARGVPQRKHVVRYLATSRIEESNIADYHGMMIDGICAALYQMCAACASECSLHVMMSNNTGSWGRD